MFTDACPDLDSGGVTESDVVTWYQGIIGSSAVSVVTKQYALMSLTKLSTRFTVVTGDIQNIIDAFGSHLDADLQQRGVEFGQLFRSQAGMRAQLLEPMPVLEKEKTVGTQENNNLAEVKENGLSVPVPSTSGLEDLLGLDDGSSSSLLSQPNTTSQPGQHSTTNALDDILGLNLGSSSSGPLSSSMSAGGPSLLDIAGPGPGMTMSGATTVQTNGGGLDSLLNGLDTMSYASPGPSDIPPLTAYEKNGLRVVFTFPSTSSSPTTILLLANNLSNGPITDFVFQV